MLGQYDEQAGQDESGRPVGSAVLRTCASRGCTPATLVPQGLLKRARFDHMALVIFQASAVL
jgi:hypothetical protein|tara:strand:- start:321 stop:506 length:186 start_codon:yes stop_codon:yes gene_type:complete